MIGESEKLAGVPQKAGVKIRGLAQEPVASLMHFKKTWLWEAFSHYTLNAVVSVKVSGHSMPSFAATLLQTSFRSTILGLSIFSLWILDFSSLFPHFAREVLTSLAHIGDLMFTPLAYIQYSTCWFCTMFLHTYIYLKYQTDTKG